MENYRPKRKPSGQLKPRINFLDISNRLHFIKEEEVTSRSKYDCSDSEYFESGIVSRAQSPYHKSPIPLEETELLLNLSSVTESAGFLEITLESEKSFMINKAGTCTSSFAEAESTMLPNVDKLTSNGLKIELEGVQVRCWGLDSIITPNPDKNKLTRILHSCFSIIQSAFSLRV